VLLAADNEPFDRKSECFYEPL